MTDNSFPVATGEEWIDRVVHVVEVPPVPLMPGVIARIVSRQNLTLSVPEIDPNLAVTIYGHPHQQMVVVLEGPFEIISEWKNYSVIAGEVIRIPPDVPTGESLANVPAGFWGCSVLPAGDLEEKLSKVGCTDS